MATSAEDMANYEQGVARLVIRARRMRTSASNPTPLRKDIEKIADCIRKLVVMLDKGGSAQEEIEQHHNEKGQPGRFIDADGSPIEKSPSFEWPSYAGIKWRLDLLADSACEAAEKLPDPREKRALPFAALPRHFRRAGRPL